MKLSYQGIQDKQAFAQANIKLPSYDWKAMAAETEVNPTWVHFGAGNIFRAFIAKLQHDLLNQGLVKGGIVAADTFDFDNINMIYRPYDSMTMLVILMPDGTMKKEVVASISKGLRVGPQFEEEREQLLSLLAKLNGDTRFSSISETGKDDT